MTPLPIELTGHLDGFALWFGHETVAVFPTWDSAVEALRAAREALPQLAATLAMAPSRGAA